MPLPTPAQVKARYPALVAVSDSTIQVIINESVPMFDEAKWGAFYEQGMIAYVAHVVTVDQKLAAGNSNAQLGVLLSKKVGDVQVNYQGAQSLNATDSFYASTTYGQRYLQLKRLVSIGVIAV
jgi:hypothetical protein